MRNNAIVIGMFLAAGARAVVPPPELAKLLVLKATGPAASGSDEWAGEKN
jgi:hypothetical protein